jgi:hypothetical protein
VVRGAVSVNVPDVGLREYDGAIELNGEWYGIETKGGTASLDARQRAADNWINTPGNSAVSVGANSGYTIVGTFDAWVPNNLP